MVDDQGNNLIAVAPEANLLLTPQIIDEISPSISACDILLVQLEVPLESVYRAIDLAYAQQKLIILNPAPAQKIADHYLAKLDFITPNETEAEILTGISVTDEQSAEKAAQWFLARGVKNVIITLGARGVYFANHEMRNMVVGYKVKAIDTTGAGDTFNGGFVSALALGEDIISAIRFGQKTAAISVTRLGTQTSMPYRDEILATDLVLA
jgi:ribokinase